MTEKNLMEIKIDRKELLKGFSRARIAASGKHNLLILSSALLIAKDGALGISATDLEIWFQGIYPTCIVKPGSIVVPIDLIFNFVKKSKSKEILLIEKERQWVNISDGLNYLNFACSSVDDFPSALEIKEMPQLSVDALDFKEMIDVATLASLYNSYDSRSFVSGAYFQIIEKENQKFFRAVSTDGSCLALIDRELTIINSCESETNINKTLIPKRCLKKIDGILLENNNQKRHNVKGFFESKNIILLSVDQNNLIVKKQQNEFVVARLLEGDFPNCEDIVKGGGNYIIADRKKLLEIMKKMVMMQNGNYIGVTVDIESMNMKTTFVNPDIGEMTEEIKIEYNGVPIQISFNPKYFIGFLQFMKSANVKLDIKDGECPCVITGKQDEGFVGVIMPMRI